MPEFKIKSEAVFHDKKIISENERRLGFAYKSVDDVFFSLQYATGSAVNVL